MEKRLRTAGGAVFGFQFHAVESRKRERGE